MILVKEADEIKDHHKDLLVSFGISFLKKIRKEIKKIKRIRNF